MKKTIAIALAIVMLFAMTSAFAWSWTCATTADKTGEASIAVIPYVKVNNGCGGFDWVQSSCAAAVQTENVYFLVKLTIPEDISPVWWKYLGDGANAAATLTFTKGGFYSSAGVASTSAIVYSVELPAALSSALPTDSSDDGWVYYMDPAMITNAPYIGAASAVSVTDGWSDDATENSGVEAADYMFGVNVASASKAKVCASITSNFDGYDEWLTYGDYTILASAAGTYTTLTIVSDSVSTPAVDAADALPSDVSTAYTQALTLSVIDGLVWQADAAGSTICSTSFATSALNYFGIQLGTCINADNIKANFGWKDKVESCYTWSGNGTSIVDVQCEVSLDIPKTGDMSVVAYAVMAVVAAAGAMGLKR